MVSEKQEEILNYIDKNINNKYLPNPYVNEQTAFKTFLCFALLVTPLLTLAILSS